MATGTPIPRARMAIWEAPRQNGDMGGTRTLDGDDAHQALPGHGGNLHGADLLPHQNGLGAIGDGAKLQVLQMHEDAPAQVAHVRGPLAQVGVVHGIEDAGSMRRQASKMARSSGRIPLPARLAKCSTSRATAARASRKDFSSAAGLIPWRSGTASRSAGG